MRWHLVIRHRWFPVDAVGLVLVEQCIWCRKSRMTIRRRPPNRKNPRPMHRPRALTPEGVSSHES